MNNAAKTSLWGFYKNLMYLLVGLIIGTHFTYIWCNMRMESATATHHRPRPSATPRSTSRPPLADNLTSFDTNTDPNTDTSATTDDLIVIGEDTLPMFLYKNTRVLCWIMTNPENHMKKAVHIRNTWGRRCNRLLFISTEVDVALETIKVDVPEGREYLWPKTREALKYIHDHYAEEADWFLKADDDTYVIMENLRVFLHQFSASEPLYFGCKFGPFVEQGYMSGGAGYVLSKEALRKFVAEAYHNSTVCEQRFAEEDIELGWCLQNINVIAGDSRDEHGVDRFVPLAPEHLIPADLSWWYRNYSFYPQDEQVSCCSHSAISFHYIEPKQFYIYEYFLYGLRPFGIFDSSMFVLPAKVNMSEVLDKWRYEAT